MKSYLTSDLLFGSLKVVWPPSIYAEGLMKRFVELSITLGYFINSETACSLDICS